MRVRAVSPQEEMNPVGEATSLRKRKIHGALRSRGDAFVSLQSWQEVLIFLLHLGIFLKERNQRKKVVRKLDKTDG